MFIIVVIFLRLFYTIDFYWRHLSLRPIFPHEHYENSTASEGGGLVSRVPQLPPS